MQHRYQPYGGGVFAQILAQREYDEKEKEVKMIVSACEKAIALNVRRRGPKEREAEKEVEMSPRRAPPSSTGPSTSSPWARSPGSARAGRRRSLRTPARYEAWVAAQMKSGIKLRKFKNI